MKFVLVKTSNDNFKKIIEINTLQDLERLQKKYRCELIVSIASAYVYEKVFPETNGRYIEIYDDYRE